MRNYSSVYKLGKFKASHMGSRFAPRAQVFSHLSTLLSLIRAFLCRLCNIERFMLDNREPLDLSSGESAGGCNHLHPQHKKLVGLVLTRVILPGSQDLRYPLQSGQQKRIVYLQGLIKKFTLPVFTYPDLCPYIHMRPIRKY